MNLSDKSHKSSLKPLYLTAYKQGIFKQRIQKGKELLKNCSLCPRSCEIDRYQEPGTVCKTGRLARVSSCFPHLGEESCLTGFRGSGTIFFGSCNLRCVFCQNWDISHTNTGKEVSPEELAFKMIHLQDIGCHNINFVTPSHVVVQILEALPIAIEMGLRVPLVYNTSIYDSNTSLALLNGIVDIYMPDFKFWSKTSAKRYSNAPDYPEIARRNLKLMHQQVGDLVLDEHGIAKCGLLVRHLVMPEHMDDTRQILYFLAKEISQDTMVNVMFQYRPEGKVSRKSYPELNRFLTRSERVRATELAKEVGLTRFA